MSNNDLVKIRGDNNLVRDMESKAILSVNKDAMNSYRLKQKNIKDNEDRLCNIENSIDNITNLLTLLLEKHK